MQNQTSLLAVGIFLAFVGFTLGLSFYLGRRAKSAGGYFAAHGEIPWFINGIAFAGDYLSAASFLGIVGMIAFYGYDGFLYSIGFLAGWAVALFLIAEPFKRLGRYTFADALDAKFGSPAIRLAAAVSTLVVSMLYLIPQMVGAGALVRPLLGIEHYWGVLIVGGVVIAIVTTAGMVSTTWVQFIKGSMLVVFCAVLTVMILKRGLNVSPAWRDGRTAIAAYSNQYALSTTRPQPSIVVEDDAKLRYKFVPGRGLLADADPEYPKPPARVLVQIPDAEASTGPLSPAGYIAAIGGSQLLQHNPVGTLGIKDQPNTYKVLFDQGEDELLPGNYFKGLRLPMLSKKLDFISLMLALFCGTASLPHIMIRYYTVKDAAAARKSTVVGITAIGFFYVLVLYIGLGAMVSGSLDPADSNMAAPLLARTFGNLPFALLTAIAFTTVLGTVSGLILASAGAVAHDIAGVFATTPLTGEQQVRLAKRASVGVGIVAIGLGIVCKNLNVGFMVGWAFNVAASANLPAIVMLLFWRGTTRQGMVASILVGLGTSVGWLLLTKEAFQNVYGVAGHSGFVPFSQPGLVTIPLSFVVLVGVSLVTRARVKRGFAVSV